MPIFSRSTFTFSPKRFRLFFPFRIFQLFGAWPKQWQVGDLDARGNDIATESLTLVYEGLYVVGI